MKKFSIKRIFAMLIFISSFASCLKKGEMNVDTENTTPTVMELQFIENGNGSTINSGMQYFTGGALTYPGTEDAHTATYNVSLAGPVTLGTDLNVTVAVDPTKVLDNYKSDSIQYELMPDSLFHIVATTATIKAGTRIAPMSIIFYPSKMDVSKSYMLPVVIKDAAGQTISGNFNTVYFHVIGNLIAGAYTQEWIRYNNIAGTGTPAYDDTFDAVFAPVNPTTISVESGSGPKYILSFTNTFGVLSDFEVKFDTASVTTAKIAIVGGPTIIKADPLTHQYEFNYTYDNLAGGLRNITDKFK